MKKIALLGLSLLFTLGALAQETTTTKEVKKVTTEKAEKKKKEAEKAMSPEEKEKIRIKTDMIINVFFKSSTPFQDYIIN